MAADGVFIDTNLLVYANQYRSPFHDRAAGYLAGLTERALRPCLSQQVLREYHATVTRPQTGEPALDAATAATRIGAFRAAFDVLTDSPAVMDALLDLVTTYRVAGRQVYDANIVATMIAHGLRRLATFNAADFRRFADLIDIEPL